MKTYFSSLPQNSVPLETCGFDHWLDDMLEEIDLTVKLAGTAKTKAIAEGEKAVALDPGGADAHVWLGINLNYADKPREAIPLFEKAIRLNPFGPAWYFLGFGNSYRMMGQYQEAITQYKKVLRIAPNNIFAHIGLAATYSLLGRDEEACVEAEEVLRSNPKLSLESYAKMLPFKNQAQTDRFVEALRKAGLK